MKAEELVRIDDLLKKTKGTDAYAAVKTIIADLPRIDIVALASELKEARELISVLREDNARLRRELNRSPSK